MKTFSDLLDTDLKVEIKIALGVSVDNGIPRCRVRINDEILYDGTIDRELSWQCQRELLEPIDIEISMSNKQYDQHRETAVIIKQLTIDEFEIVPGWTHLATYQNDHDRKAPTAYLGFNGTWRLFINRPFYQWRHEVTGQGWLLTPAIQ